LQSVKTCEIATFTDWRRISIHPLHNYRMTTMILETIEAPECLADMGERARANAIRIAKSLVEAGVEAEKSMRIAVCTAKRLSEVDRRCEFGSTKSSRGRSWSSQSTPLALVREGRREPLATEELPSA
jgi:hypothetical protein